MGGDRVTRVSSPIHAMKNLIRRILSVLVAVGGVVWSVRYFAWLAAGGIGA